MKKFLIYFPAILGLLWACNPMKDTYNELDNKQQPYKEDITYTLVTADYSTASKAALVDSKDKADSAKANLIKSQQAFNERFTGNDYVGSVLSAVYPALNAKSSAKVTYNQNLNDLGYLNKISTAITYIVSDANYSSIGGKVAKAGLFTPLFAPENYIPNFITKKDYTPAEGDFALVTYKLTDIEPSTADLPSTNFNENFEGGVLSKFVVYSVTGDLSWVIDATHGVNGSKCVKISGYDQGTNYENEDWLIIPTQDLSSTISTLSFSSAYKYAGTNLVLKYSTDYSGSGDPSVATWTNISFTTAPEPGNFVWTSTGTIDLPAPAHAASVSIAFVYTSTSTEARTWELDDIVLTSKNSSAEIPYKTYNDFYSYTNSKWVKATNKICIHPFEYAQMGVEPGANNRFSTTISPANYLPLFLKNKYPLAVEGDVKVIAYNYNTSKGTSLIAEEYRYKAGAWSAYNGITAKTDQFIHTGEKWIFDPTVRLIPIAADFQLLVDWVYANLSRSYGSKYGNDEYYYGASAYYLNFDLRLTNKTTYKIPGFDTGTDAEKIAKTWVMLQEGLIKMLELKYPAAVPDVNGFKVYYWLTFNTYENDLSKKTYIGIFKCTTAGPNPVFERDIEYEDSQVTAGVLTAAQVKWNRP